MIEVVSALEEHAELINLRKEDKAEAFLSSGTPPKDAVRASIENSLWSYVALDDGVPFCIFGVAPYKEEPTVGCPWFMASDAIFKHRQLFLRSSLDYVHKMLTDFDILTNVVDIHNIKAHRWLKWLGFEFYRTIPYGPFNHPFIQFIKHV
jgi:hypothetical protein